MVKKISAALIVFLLSFLPVAHCFAASPTISVGTAAGMPGDTVTVPVRISGNPGINTFSLGFTYDSRKLTLVNVTVSPQLGGQFVYNKKAVWLNGTDSRYNGDILYLVFSVSGSASYGETNVSVSCSPGDISNYNEDNVNFTVSPGGVIIGLKQQMVNKLVAFIMGMIDKIKRFFV